MRLALGRAGAYRRLFERLDLGGTAAVRTAAVLMLCSPTCTTAAARASTGHRAVAGSRGRLRRRRPVAAGALSPRWAATILRPVERDFLRAAGGLRTLTPAAPVAA